MDPTSNPTIQKSVGVGVPMSGTTSRVPNLRLCTPRVHDLNVRSPRLSDPRVPSGLGYRGKYLYVLLEIDISP